MDGMGMQKLQEQIIAGIEAYFDNYDWDKAFTKYLETKDE